MVTGTAGNGFIGYFSALSVGSMSPSTSDAIGTSPSIIELYHAFGFTLLKFSGYFDNSSITGLSLTPSGGSTFTMTFGSFSRDQGDNYTIFSDASGSTLSNNTTYTVQILGDTTNVNTEGTTLERRNPKDFNDFFGATRNVQPISGVMKLSYLHDAVKYQWSSSMTAGKQIFGPPANLTIRGYHVGFSIGSMTSTSISGIINTYNGNTIISISETFDQASSSYSPTLIVNTGPNSQWYKLQIGSAAFYREDATFSANPNSPFWTTFSWNTGSTQNIVENNTYAIKLTC
jgi:hypothetical protein